MNHEYPLSLEQEFELRVFSDRVQNFSREDAQLLLIELYKSTMVLENVCREMVDFAWTMGQGNTDLEIGSEPLSF